MDTVHPRSSLKKFHHHDKADAVFANAQQAVFNPYEVSQDATPRNSEKPYTDIPHRFPLVDLNLDVERMLHESHI